MSKDIRSFFAPVKGGPSAKDRGNDEKKLTVKKRVYNVIDSDDDDLVQKPQTKKPKEDKRDHRKRQATPSKKVKEENNTKPVDVNSFFGSSPVQQEPQTLIKPRNPSTENTTSTKKGKGNKTRKRKNNSDLEGNLTLEDHFDDDFNTTLSLLDEEKLGITPKKAGEKEPHSDDKLRKVKKATPEKLKTPRKDQTPSSTDKVIHVVKKKTPEKAEKKNNIESFKNERSVEKLPCDDDTKRKTSAEAYHRYLQRGGPRNPGGKSIPEGAPGCLQGKSFVITGVLESLEREEASDLIKKYGGRVTSSVSKKTNYVIIGEEPGESKVKKADQFNVPQISEDRLLDLIGSSQKQKKEEESSKYFTEKKNESLYPPQPKKMKLNNENPTDVHFYDKKPLSKNCDSGMVSGSSYTDSESTSSQKPDASEVSRDVGDQLWVEKYKPKNTKAIIGQNGEKSNVKKLTKWLTDWFKHHASSDKKKSVRPAPYAHNDEGSYYKAALLSGPPGVGKTTSVHLVCKELDFDVIEFNASDTRSKRLLSDNVGELLGSKSIRNFYSGESSQKKHVLVMDEVDGMAGNEDRGGVQELIQLIKHSKTPIICMCNDRNHPKIRSLANYCFDLRFPRPRVEQIKGALMSICYREGINIPNDALVSIITSANQDVRQVLHNLFLWVVKDKGLTSEQAKIDAEKAKKSLKMGPWDVVRQVFSLSDQEKMTFREKEELFFQDYNLGPLFVQDTYIHVKPFRARGNKVETLKCLSKAADSLAWGDVTEKMIRSQNAWGLLPVQAIFSSVLPGHEIAGHVMGQIQFPAWLGKNSKRNRMDRLLQELHVHTRLRTSGSKRGMNLDYAQPLRDAILRPLRNSGTEGIPEALEVMKTYQLLREDLDSLVELCQWPNRPDPYAGVDSKVKAAFTRAYNKECPATSYAVIGNVKKTQSDDAELMELLEEGESEKIMEDEEETDDIAADAMIKKGKPKKTTSKEDSGAKNEKKSKASASRKNKEGAKTQRK